MRHPTTLTLTAAAAFALAACGTDDDPAGTDGAPADTGTSQDTAPQDTAPDDGGAPADDAAAGDGIVVEMIAADGADAGTVTFADVDGALVVQATLSGLAPGLHGFHLHEVPACDPDAADGPFTSAEGHWAPDGEDHAEHPGDLPPLYALEDGSVETTVTVDGLTVADLQADGGRAVMVHDGPDNLANVPDRYVSEETGEPGPDQETLDTGDAGDRAACGTTGEDGDTPDTDG